MIENPTLEDCFLYKQNVCNKLIVAFSCYDPYRKENGKFDFYFLTKWTDVDVLLVRDLENTWYQRPILDDENSSDKLFNIIKNIVEKYKEVIFTGSSMGGFGAIFFGHRIENVDIISFGGQLTIKNEKSVVISDEMDGLYKRAYDLATNKDMTSIQTMNFICKSLSSFIGTLDNYDMACCALMPKGENIKVYHLRTTGILLCI